MVTTHEKDRIPVSELGKSSACTNKLGRKGCEERFLNEIRGYLLGISVFNGQLDLVFLRVLYHDDTKNGLIRVISVYSRLFFHRIWLRLRRATISCSQLCLRVLCGTDSLSVWQVVQPKALPQPLNRHRQHSVLSRLGERTR